jgi:hypothetical protein
LSARNRAITRATTDGRAATVRRSASLATEKRSGEILLFDILIYLLPVQVRSNLVTTEKAIPVMHDQSN